MRCERRTVLPSIATTWPATAGQMPLTHRTKHASNCRASSAANTRPNVSCEAIPLRSGKYRRSHSSCPCAHKAIPTQVSAPDRPTFALDLAKDEVLRREAEVDQ